jgi:demethoxyubiquinone hydroxylase (CLK1/Coq7/Cat5 family)
MLKLSHGIEVGAWNAYQGHWQSLKDEDEVAAIRFIQQEELGHQINVEYCLEDLGSARSPTIDFIFRMIGKFMGLLCKFMGHRLPMMGAGMIETLGVMNYNIVANEARKQGQERMAQLLDEMAETEREHKLFFQKKSDRPYCLWCGGRKGLMRCNIYNGTEKQVATGFICEDHERCWKNS